MEKESHLLPLLSPSATPPADKLNLVISTNSPIFLRLSFVLLVTLVSIWANHEASKGYAITVINESTHTHAFSTNRFQLFYVSNDEATRIVLKASQIIENFLYQDPHATLTKKRVSHLILKLSGRNLTDDIIVESTPTNPQEFLLHISPSIIQNSNFKHAMPLALQKGIARVWLWDGRGNAPTNLINGLVEYITNNFLCGSSSAIHLIGRPTSSSCWNHGDAAMVADFVKYWERRRPGFVRALNQAMRSGWDDGILGGAVGQPGLNICTEYYSWSV